MPSVLGLFGTNKMVFPLVLSSESKLPPLFFRTFSPHIHTSDINLHLNTISNVKRSRSKDGSADLL